MIHQYEDFNDRIESTVLSDRNHVSRKGTTWCGTRYAGHYVPVGTQYRKTVSIVDGEFDVWVLCRDCEADLMGYEGLPKHRLHKHPEAE